MKLEMELANEIKGNKSVKQKKKKILSQTKHANMPSTKEYN